MTNAAISRHAHMVRLGPVWCTMVTIGLLMAGAFSRATAQAPHRLTLDRYLDMEGVKNPKISPDGSRVVYEREWIDRMSDSRRSALWIVNADGSNNRYLAEGGSARWSPSGDRLAFVACTEAGRERRGQERCDGESLQVFVRVMEGDGVGSITQVTRVQESVSNPSWSPDGRQIAFVMFVPDDDSWDVDLPGKPVGAEWTAAPRIIDGLWYRRDRRGFFGNGRENIFVVPAIGGTPRRVTPDLYDHEDLYTPEDPEWSPDGSVIYFDGLRDPDADYRWTTGGYASMETEIYSVEVTTGEVRQLTTRIGTDRQPRVSPDGRFIAYTGLDSTSHTYGAATLYVMRADGSESRALTENLDRSPENVIWAPDGSGVYFSAGNEGTVDLYFVSREGEVERITEGNHTLSTTGVAANSTAVGVWSTPRIPEDVVTFSLRRPDLRRVTHVNDDLLAGVQLGEAEEIWYESKGGMRVQGWIVKPPDFDANRTYPLILSIHGGPHSMYDVGFNYSFQNWAANGYVVLYTNPRGSTGYGSAFGNAIDKDYPGDDFHDLMRGVAAVVDRGFVDPDNLFVTGCSGGGILTAWTVGHTDRFAAAVARCPITNWVSFVGTVDGPYWYNQFERLPWEDPREHLRRSPLTYVKNITTPTLLMTGVNDLRTPIAQTEEFYQALKMERVPTKMIRMNGEWHGTTSKPSNFLRTQLYVMKWFETYMTDSMKRMISDR